MTQKLLEESPSSNQDRDGGHSYVTAELRNGLDTSNANADLNNQAPTPEIPTDISEIKTDILVGTVGTQVLEVENGYSSHLENPVASTSGEEIPQEPAATPPDGETENQRTPGSGTRDQSQNIIPSPPIPTETHSFLSLDLGFSTFERSDKLEEENEKLRQRLDVLERENQILRGNYRVLYEEQEAWQKQLDDADARVNDLLIENRSLKTLPRLKSNEYLETAFRDLSIDIGSWCDEASFNAARCLLASPQVNELQEKLSLSQPIDQQILEANRKSFGQAIIWKALVDQVFQNSPQDSQNYKDLWTSFDEEKHLVALETRIMAGDLSFRDLTKWRCLTVGGLSQHSEVIGPRIKSLTKNVFAFISALFGFTNVSKVNSLRDDLERNVMMTAVKLSKDIRMHPSRVYIRLPARNQDSKTTGAPPDRTCLKAKMTLCEKNTDTKVPTPLCLTIRPAMTRETDTAEFGTRERVVIECATVTIVSKVTPSRSNTD